MQLDKQANQWHNPVTVIREHTFSGATQTDPRDQRIADLEAQLRERDAVIANLQGQIRQLQEQLAGAKRVGKRQATPFAREKRVTRPKRPGRKKGKGRFASRRRPAAEEVTEKNTPYAVKVALSRRNTSRLE